MNDRWFNFAVAIAIFTIMANSFILFAATQKDQNGNYSTFLIGAQHSASTYSNLTNNSKITIGDNASLNSDSSTSPTSDQGLTIATTDSNSSLNGGVPIGLGVFDYVSILLTGFEQIMVKFAWTFGNPNFIFLGLAAMGIFSKFILGGYLFTVLLRPLLGRVW